MFLDIISCLLAFTYLLLALLRFVLAFSRNLLALQTPLLALNCHLLAKRILFPINKTAEDKYVFGCLIFSLLLIIIHILLPHYRLLQWYGSFLLPNHLLGYDTTQISCDRFALVQRYDNPHLN